jgi:hypothetical protein
MVVGLDEIHPCIPIVDEVFISWAIEDLVCEMLVWVL